MALKIGNNAVANAFVGTSQVRRAYKGGTLVYQGFGPASEQEFIEQEATGGPAQLLKVYGKTIVWRQLVQNGDFSGGVVPTGWSASYLSKTIADNVCHLKVTSLNIAAGFEFTHNSVPPVANHFYMLKFRAKMYGSYFVKQLGGSFGGDEVNINYDSQEWGWVSCIATVGASPSPRNYFRFYIPTNNGTVGDDVADVTDFQIIDLTDLYGAGNEPTSVAQFEADYPEYDPTYDPGSLQSNKTTELRAERIPAINGTYYPHWRGSLALNLSTLTGKLNGEGASVVVYPDGLRGVGDIRDEAEGSTAVQRIGSRAYQSGDESDPDVITDGTSTFYPLATPLTYTLDTPLPTDLTCEQGDILQRVSDNNCPFVGEMKFGL